MLSTPHKVLLPHVGKLRVHRNSIALVEQCFTSSHTNRHLQAGKAPIIVFYFSRHSPQSHARSFQLSLFPISTLGILKIPTWLSSLLATIPTRYLPNSSPYLVNYLSVVSALDPLRLATPCRSYPLWSNPPQMPHHYLSHASAPRAYLVIREQRVLRRSK